MTARVVDLPGVQELLQGGAQLLEVLPREEYEEMHLPDAIHIPLKELDRDRAAELIDRGRPVVVYCWDQLCDMSPRAACLLGVLGYEAFDYAASKVDWIAHGLPTEGTAAAELTAGSLAREDVATCTLDEHAEQISPRIEASAYGFALVLAGQVVLGRIRSSQLGVGSKDATAEQLMEPGPSTMRPHTALGDLRDVFQRRGTRTAVLTTPEGELLGVVRCADLPA